MGAIEKTDALIRVPDFPLNLLEANEKNPNKMKDREFNHLVDNMGRLGWTEAALIRPLEFDNALSLWKECNNDASKFSSECISKNIKFRIIGGHHRVAAARYLDFEKGPVTILMDPNFTSEEEVFQVVRMNVIHGKMDPTSFVALIGDLSEKYADDVLQDLLGFTDDAEFKRLTKQLAKSLPDKATQDKFKQAAEEIKTIDGLAKLLNQMFTMYGDTLPYGYMVFDYGEHKSMWLRCSSKTLTALELLGVTCIDNKKTMDDLMANVLEHLASSNGQPLLKNLIGNSPDAKVPKSMTITPTKDNLAKMESLS